MDLRDTGKSRYFAITEFILYPPFSLKSDRKKDKSVVSFTHEQNIICSQTKLDDNAHEQTIICRQLFTGHVVGSQPMKRKKNLQRMMVTYIIGILTMNSNIESNA